MTRRRRLLANAVILAILCGQLLAIVLDRELWPFSPYSMYSDLRRGPAVTRLWLYGVAADGTEAPLELSMVHPYRFPQLETALSRLQGADVQEGLRDILARYEARRRAGRHAGPTLSALRLYRMTWTADPRVANRDRPLERDLLAEAGAR
ncbi:MAG: hypothetical protein ACHQ1G_09935 [Planctomycetota bacterium]